MKAAGGSIEYISKHELNLVVDNRPHQVSPRYLTSSLMTTIATRKSCLPDRNKHYFMQLPADLCASLQ